MFFVKVVVGVFCVTAALFAGDDELADVVEEEGGAHPGGGAARPGGGGVDPQPSPPPLDYEVKPGQSEK